MVAQATDDSKAQLMTHDKQRTIPPDVLDSSAADYEKPENLIGEQLLLEQPTRARTQRAIQAQTLEHLNHFTDTPSADAVDKPRIGKTRKSLNGKFGALPIAMRRDHHAAPEPQTETTTGPEVPKNQAQRLAALRSYAILDTPREGAFDDIVGLAVFICQTPMVVINFIDAGRQWFKAEIGLGVREMPLDISICAHAILQPGLFIVPDLREDNRFSANPLVTGDSAIRFYAGALLQSPDGYALGTICVMDTKPRTLSEEQKILLLSLARQTMLQLELRKTLAMAARAHRYRSRLMAVAGHDLKQPLQVIMMVLDILEAKLVDPNAKPRLQLAHEAIERMATGLDQLASASILDQESDIPTLRTFSIADILDSIDATWREHAAHKGVRLRVMYSSARVLSDVAMLRTMIGNLVGNAIKYTPRGSVLVGCRRLKNELLIQVVDSGIGIEAARMQALFAAFHQEDARSEGLGLGLSIVQRTAEALGHRIRVQSRVGRGSLFSICVPLAID